ncbi:hypothetical protein CLPUN_27650 [Clostridium puniceum]|uniref:Uncharacterized protein n=1 Tax=Clostridium puniceum TaxID=29367 RepID=A0A1S8TF69_9CLOT|nr:hypothetical protein [Clostridium puniceum]OOM76264.1 hypothetical protein CLPUN_27650 [Clostridium puniceum]
MEYNESNFVYLKTTSIERYYDELVKAEYICEYCPKITKMIVRKVVEGILKNIGEKYSIESDVAVWELLNNIKLSSSFFLPDEIHDSIELVLVNGYEHACYHNKNKKISKHPIEILETIHDILCWYLKNIEPEKKLSIEDLSFRAPSTIEYQEKELNKINEEILLKDKQINNLRQKIIGLGDKWDNIREINETIIVIKEEKAELESIQLLLGQKFEEQKNKVVEVEKDYNIYIKKFEQLEESCIEIQELIFNTESRLVKAEIQTQELKALVKELEEQDENVKKIEQSLEDELKTVRHIYENLIKLSIKYQDCLETIEFSYDKKLNKILEGKISNLTMKISFEDRIFNENIMSYTKNIGDAKRKVRNFKELLNEKLNRELKYKLFYSGFLKLQSRELRIIYTISNNMSSLISKPKDLILKSGEDRFLEAINKNFNELKNISDYEIKLILYYKLIKLSKVSLGNIHNRKEVIHVLDSIVDKAYEILMNKKDFKGRLNKLDAINAYYLEKIILHLKNTGGNLQINDEITDKIYDNIIQAKQRPENMEKGKIHYDKFNLDTMSEEIFKSSIKAHVFDFLSIMVDLGTINHYREIASIIFEIEKLIIQKPTLKIHGEDILREDFSNEHYIIFSFLSSGATLLNHKQQEELLPLLVSAIVSVKVSSEDYEEDLEIYNALVDLWKHKQQIYNDIFIQKEDKENELEVLIKEKKQLENNCKDLLKSHDAACENYDDYKEEFKQIVMNSEKRILLQSYMEYEKMRIKKEVAENHLNEAKNKLGVFKRMLSPEVWMDQASKLINEANMMELEKSLIEEAKEKVYFKKDYEVFAKRKKKIQEVKELVDKEKEKIKNKDIEIDNLKIKLDEFQRQLNNMKNAYLDIEEGYF